MPKNIEKVERKKFAEKDPVDGNNSQKPPRTLLFSAEYMSENTKDESSLSSFVKRSESSNLP
jgi:hypothetical protein